MKGHGFQPCRYVCVRLGIQPLGVCVIGRDLFFTSEMSNKESMSRFFSYEPDQAYLLPPNIKDVLGKGHLCFHVHRVVEALDVSHFEQAYGAGDVWPTRHA